MSDTYTDLYIQDREVGHPRHIGGGNARFIDLRFVRGDGVGLGLETVDVSHHNATQVRICFEGQTQALKQMIWNDEVTYFSSWYPVGYVKTGCNWNAVRIGSADAQSNSLVGVRKYVSTSCDPYTYRVYRTILKFDIDYFFTEIDSASLKITWNYGGGGISESDVQLVSCPDRGLANWDNFGSTPFLDVDYKWRTSDNFQPGYISLNQSGINYINTHINTNSDFYFGVIEVDHDLNGFSPPETTTNSQYAHINSNENYRPILQATTSSVFNPPLNLAVADEGGYAKCTWTAVNEYHLDEYPEYFEVQRSATSSPSNYSIIGISYVWTPTSELLDNVLFNENRWYRVRSVSGTGAGPWSDAVQAI